MLNVELRNVAVQYGTYPAVEDISFDVAGGQFVGIVGPTGCGKSSLLNVVAGPLAAAPGHVCDGGSAGHWSQSRLRLHVPNRRLAALEDCPRQRAARAHPARHAEVQGVGS